ncbi:MAG: ABC transporter ATP-binding protein, partial [Proteobacteria bacterium]|nr:ABC transporter ATP-binding protein [Pseudomonadota bacterium]
IKNTTIKQLLTTLDVETFIFDLDKKPSEELLTLLDAEITEDNSIQLDVHKSQALNDVFKQIDHLEYKVLSMRNKVNRLEELFFKMTHKNKPQEVES